LITIFRKTEYDKTENYTTFEIWYYNDETDEYILTYEDEHNFKGMWSNHVAWETSGKYAFPHIERDRQSERERLKNGTKS
jgi:hypothetical protein